MELKVGYLYHIKDEFFETIKDKYLMVNKNEKRPVYLAIRDNNIFWCIPLSSQVKKYKKIIKQKIEKYGKCKTICIMKIMNKEQVILLQNAFPTLAKYIIYLHEYYGMPVKLNYGAQKEILDNFTYMLKMKKRGVNLFFSDIDFIKEKMLQELVTS